MALTYVGGTSNTGTGATYTVSLSGTLTGGSDTSPSTGDIVVVFSGFAAAAQSAPTVTGNTSGAYVGAGAAAWANDTWDANFRAFYQIMGATPDITLTVARTSSAAYGGATVVQVWRGVDTTTPLDATGTPASGTNSGRFNPPSITPTTAGAILIYGGAGSQPTATGVVPTDTNTSTYHVAAKGDGTTADIGVAMGAKAWTSGAFDAAANTNIPTSTSAGWGAQAIALKPAPIPQYTKVHTVSSFTRKEYTKTHTTDSLKHTENTRSHTTGSVRHTIGSAAHTTDALKAGLERYCVGGTGTWDASDTTHWSNTSGGSGGFSVPTSSYDVYFDGNSGTGVVTISGATGTCKSLNFTGYTGTFNHPSGTSISVYGSLTLSAGMTYAVSTSPIYLRATTSGNTITTNGKSTPALNFYGSGEYVLQDNLTSAKGIIVDRGTLNTNGVTVSVATINIYANYATTLIFGASQISCSSYFTNYGNNVTLDAGTSTLTCTNGFSGGMSNTSVFNNLVFNCSNSSNSVQIGNLYQCTNLTINNVSSTSAIYAYFYPNNMTTTVTGTFTASGYSNSMRLVVTGYLENSGSYTINAANTTLSNVDFRQITATGAASWSGTSIGDATANTGITFSTPTTRYWIGNSGSWGQSSHWSTVSGGSAGTSIPLPQDNVVFDSNSFNTTLQSVSTSNVAALGKDITFTSDVVGSPQINLNSVSGGQYNIGITGNLTLSTSVIIISSGKIIFSGANAQTITSNGAEINNVTISNKLSGGTVTLLDDVAINASSNKAFCLDYSSPYNHFDANDHNVTVTNGTLSGMSIDRGTLYMGNGTWTIHGIYGWQAVPYYGITINAEGSTIVLDNASTDSKLFMGADQTYNNLVIATDNCFIGDNNTFNNLTINNAGGTNGTKLEDGKTQTIIGDFITNGSSDNLVKILSGIPDTPATLSKTSGVVAENYMSIQDITATGGATWYAGAHSINVSGNTGWLFSNAPTAITKTHTTDSVKHTQNIVSHTSGSNKRLASTRTHNTDSLKRKQSALTHTTNSLKRLVLAISHTTSSLKRKTTTILQTVDTLLRKTQTKTHTTDSNKKAAQTRSHTTSSAKHVAQTLVHTLDSNKRNTVSVSHTSDAYKVGLTRYWVGGTGSWSDT